MIILKQSTQAIKFYSPDSMDDLLKIMSETNSVPIAGGTDLIPRIRKGSGHIDNIVDLSKMNELRFIEEINGQISLGALTTYSDIVSSTLLGKEAPLLVQAASKVGSEQTRNRGTIGGGLGNASPAADSICALLALNAEISLISKEGTRLISLDSFILGPGSIKLNRDEIIHHVSFPSLSDDTYSTFLKLGKKAAMSCAIANLAIVLQKKKAGNINDIRIAVGAVAPTAIRCVETEEALLGEKVTSDLIVQAAQTASKECDPIDDVRGTAKYRRHAVAVLVERGLNEIGIDKA